MYFSKFLVHLKLTNNQSAPLLMLIINSLFPNSKSLIDSIQLHLISQSQDANKLIHAKINKLLDLLINNKNT